MGCPCRVSLFCLANPCASVVELLMFTNSDLQLLLAPTGQSTQWCTGVVLKIAGTSLMAIIRIGPRKQKPSP